ATSREGRRGSGGPPGGPAARTERPTGGDWGLAAGRGPREGRPPLVRAAIAEPVQFVAGKRGDPGDVETVCLRHGDVAQRLLQAITTEQLHATGVGDVHLWMASWMDFALDEQRAHAELSEHAGEHEADRATPRDDHRNVGGRSNSLHQLQHLQLLNECEAIGIRRCLRLSGLGFEFHYPQVTVCVTMRVSKFQNERAPWPAPKL